MELEQLWRDKAFLGQEFLTWLWYLGDGNQSLDLPALGPVQVILGERLVLGPPPGAEGAHIAVRGLENAAAEARAALGQGKLAESMRLGLVVSGEEHWLTLKADDLSVGSLKLPAVAAPEGADDLQGLVLERMALIDRCLQALEGLLAHFMDLRLADGPALAAELRAWAAGEEG